ncbi:MAG: DEAD/DEAH box helicase [Proteobacteria bacterium]|nr:DEAD/DEAH box helicase [Pseudomonadota bacterium]MBU1685942.1 DEAD/DEAH box helicase [Pseudomonadota bacterium]
MPKPTSTNTKLDPYYFDQEELQTIADDHTIRQGLTFYKENRVIEIDLDHDLLWGKVEDTDSDIPYDAEVRLTEAGELSYRCSCAADQMESTCRHIVAVLYAYADQSGETNELMSAADHAIKERSKRGRSEVQVEPTSGEPWFGSWRATSLTSSSPFPRSYRITIRSLHRRANLCNCPDFANNQLGTCKHIEAVLHKISKNPAYDTFREQPAPFPYIYLAWDVDQAPQLRLHRPRTIPTDLQPILADYFSAGGGFTGRLPDDFFRFTEIVDDRSDVHIGEDAIAYARQLAADAAHQLRSSAIRSQIRALGKVPGVKARLYPYQIEGTAFLAGTGRALLADDMGLGKTLQAISAAGWLREHEGVKTVLIICPASLKQQWANEIGKFTDLTSQVVQGPPTERGTQYRRACDFFILNYELIRRDLSLINETLRPDLIILDEAQRIKNWHTMIASAVKLIPSRYAFVLSGTPLENRLEELYSLMQVVDPKVLGPLWRYMVDFHVTDDRGKVLGYRNLSVLRQRLAPVMLRRDRRLVKDQLPDRIDQQLNVAMTDKQLELHDSALSNAGKLAQIAKHRPLTPSEQNRLMAALQQARMACDAAGLVDKETEGSPKIDELANILEEFCLQAGLKAVVFSQWELMTKMVEKRLRRMGLGFVRLHGGVPTAKRGALMDRFREDDSVQVFLSTDAGGVGLNLQSGSLLVNLDVPWNPAVLEQRNGRVHRLGQTNKVQIITMVAGDSYEEHVLSLVKNKQHLFDNVIAEDASEDVVGVSKKLLDTLLETLPQLRSGTAPEQEPGTDLVAAREQLPQDDGGDRPATGPPDDMVSEALTRCIEELQNSFGARIERIIGSGGGLLAVLDQVDAEADQVAARLSSLLVPVAVIDLRTLNGLNRLGAASPLTTDRTYFAADEQRDAPKTSRLMALAREKFQAAQVLVAQKLPNPALELLLSALLAAAADRAGLANPISPQAAGVWLYGEALPQGLLSQAETNLINKAISLGQCPTLPEQLIVDLLHDTESFLNGEPKELL